MRIVIISLVLLYSFAFPEKCMNDSKTDRISFGRTGGFTNMTVEYALFENGKVYKIKGSEMVKVCRIKKERVSEIVCSITCSGFKDLTINEPGNMTYFIKVVRSDFQNEVRWSDNDQNPQLKALYDSLMNTVKSEEKTE
jgi:hypothetical protein